MVRWNLARLALVAALTVAGSGALPGCARGDGDLATRDAPRPDPQAAAAPQAAAVPQAIAAPAAEQPYTEWVSRVRFPLPAAGFSVTERHHDPTLPLRKFRHSIHLATERGTVILVDVWDNPQHLAVHDWFDATLGFLVQQNTRVSDEPMGRARVPGIMLHEPQSPQALSQGIAVFAAGEQVFRITVIDEEGDAVARSAFERIVADIETGVGP